ncbi:HAMP domain-containing histidine kinase [Francisella sp. Scap27]|nr:HAMP domain-containing sensor histidine kinase [Francisella sp. Scap27]QLE79968.1 HAMP domain-containing histidine kinase [Francisella sp. Scap27]
MAILFTILLAMSIMSWGYVIYSSVGGKILEHIVPLSIGIFSTLSVVIISFAISIFVVRTINHISSSAASIVNTEDFSRRIKSISNWDDLSNLSSVLNILFGSIDTLLKDIKSVTDNIAHDLKTPLTRLKNKLENIHETNPNKEILDAMDECDKLLEVFNSLLKLNRLEHGREKLQKKRIEISYLINDATELYTPILEEKNITIKSQLAQKTLNIDKNLIFQSIVNILDNCYKYSGENTCVSIKGFIKGSSYNLKISDSGNGVNSDNSDKIFERFFREDTSRTQVGNGLGLALVKNIIELHGGSIEAKANIPQGLTMTIKLPLH